MPERSIRGRRNEINSFGAYVRIRVCTRARAPRISYTGPLNCRLEYATRAESRSGGRDAPPVAHGCTGSLRLFAATPDPCVCSPGIYRRMPRSTSIDHSEKSLRMTRSYLESTLDRRDTQSVLLIGEEGLHTLHLSLASLALAQVYLRREIRAKDKAYKPPSPSSFPSLLFIKTKR